MNSAPRFARQKPFVLVPLLAALLASGCSSPFKPLPGPVDYGRSARSEGTIVGSTVESGPTATQIDKMPAPPLPKAGSSAQQVPAERPVPGAEDEVTIAIEQTPLPMFIQILYGNILKRAYSLDPAVTSRTDPVTFKTSRPMSRARMQQIAANLLRSYGLAVIELDGMVRIAPDNVTNNASTKLQLGKQLPEGVDQFRPGYQYVELDTVKVAELAQWVRQIMGNRVTLTEDSVRNAVMLSGTQADIKASLDLVQALDQPRMRGRIARRVVPAYASVADLATRLNEVLTAQGYAVGIGGSNSSATVILMPVQANSSLYVFAGSSAVMDHVERWARELDKPSTGPSANALFTYAVKYADAQELARTLGELLGGGGSAGASAGAGGSGSSGGSTTPTRQGSFGRVVVNSATNTLIFKGSTAEEQQQIKDLLRELDRPTKSAMIEVVVAEVTRGGLEELGIKWNYARNGISGGTPTTAKVDGDGFNVSFGNSAATLLGALNALASDKQARILSNPKILARNGETASIQVGNEVPIITTQQSGATGGFFPGNGNIVQQVQYRSTGVILRVRPVINAGKRLDLDIAQEVSSASSTKTGVSASPTISTKRIETKLSLRDGSTILLGGLISRDDSVSDSGVPLLKDVPLLGHLFKSQSTANNQTELLVMITPYVVNDDYEAEELTQAIQNTFGDWAKDVKTSRVAREPVPPTDLPVHGKPTARPPALTAPESPAQPEADPRDVPASTVDAPARQGSQQAQPDFEVSRPAGSATPLPAQPAESTAGGTPASAVAPSPAASAASAPASAPKTPVALPQGAKGTAVTDPKVLDDIMKLVKPK